MTGAEPDSRMPGRVRTQHVEWVAERLSERDWAVIEAVNRLRIMSGQQLERLLFHSLSSSRSRIVTRSRVLLRLTAWRVLVPLERRVGGHGRGSSGQLYALDSAGQRLLAARQAADGMVPRLRRPGTPGERTVRHTVAGAELAVSLVELGRVEGFTVANYLTEPAAWWPAEEGARVYYRRARGLNALWGGMEDTWPYLQVERPDGPLPVDVQDQSKNPASGWRQGSDVVPLVE